MKQTTFCQLNSLLEFWQMDGHGPFVWAAVAVTLVVMVVLIIAPIQRRKRLLMNVRAEQQRQIRRAANR